MCAPASASVVWCSRAGSSYRSTSILGTGVPRCASRPRMALATASSYASWETKAPPGGHVGVRRGVVDPLGRRNAREGGRRHRRALEMARPHRVVPRILQSEKREQRVAAEEALAPSQDEEGGLADDRHERAQQEGDHGGQGEHGGRASRSHTASRPAGCVARAPRSAPRTTLTGAPEVSLLLNTK